MQMNFGDFSFKLNEPQVQASLIIASVTIITVILGFAIKDYIIPGIIEKRSKKREGQQLFNRYKVHLFKSALFFANRLSEIFRTRSHYLWIEAPKSDFYEYKYLSTIYRLCALLGWIRAYRLEEASISIRKSDKEIHLLSGGLDKLVSSFADGQNIEMYVAKALCKLHAVEIDKMPVDRLELFSVEIDHIVQEVLTNSGKEYVSELSDQKQTEFITKFKNLLTKLSIEGSLVDSTKADVIKAVSIKQGLIYRDWQQAIGDLMLGKKDTTDVRKYDWV